MRDLELQKLESFKWNVVFQNNLYLSVGILLSNITLCEGNMRQI